MEINQILIAIDAEIQRLKEARTILSGLSGRHTRQASSRKRRHLSAQARARIAAAQKARWAKLKKQAK